MKVNLAAVVTLATIQPESCWCYVTARQSPSFDRVDRVGKPGLPQANLTTSVLRLPACLLQLCLFPSPKRLLAVYKALQTCVWQDARNKCISSLVCLGMLHAWVCLGMPHVHVRLL